MASTSLKIVPSSTGNRKTFTISTWVKRASLSSLQGIIGSRYYDGNTDGSYRADWIRFGSGDSFMIYNHPDAGNVHLETNRLFRDVSSWYHIVVAVDTTQATDTNRLKMYVNGTQETSFSTSIYPSLNQDTEFNLSGNEIYIGTLPFFTGGADPNRYFNGSMAHFHFIDGTAYAASAFGETDATTGIWKPKTAPSVTYGTNGFFLKFANSGSMGTDSSGNGNNFTVSGNLTQTVDTPSNVFATFNPLSQGVAATSRVFSNGNTSVTFNGADDSSLSTMGVSQGKWYSEFKVTNDAADPTVGVGNESSNLVTNPGACNIGSVTGEFGYFSNGQKRINGGSLTAYGSSFTTNDIIGVALDLDNGAIWFSKNGTWQNSATIGEIEAGTTTNAAATSLLGTFFFGCSNSASGTTGDAFSANFGNGYFGTTAVSSAQSPSDGIGIFEYEVPSGYKALCTKSINAQEYS